MVLKAIETFNSHPKELEPLSTLRHDSTTQKGAGKVAEQSEDAVANQRRVRDRGAKTKAAARPIGRLSFLPT